jgi:predicted transcriptional regulator
MTELKEVTFVLPEDLVSAADAAAARDRRSRSEIVQAALQWYLRRQELPVEEPTPEEIEAIAAGRDEVARGDFVTFEDVKHDLETDLRQARTEKSKNVSAQ